jgi:sugar lactone lactonase YvrE
MTAVEVLDGRVCALGEGPWYDGSNGRAYWVDILGSRILWRELGTGTAGELSTPGHVGAAVPRTGGGLVLCLPDGPLLRDPDGTLHRIGGYPAADGGSTVDGNAPRLRSNDAKADPAGRLWLGTMAYDNTPGAGALYLLRPGAPAPERILGDVTISNGLGWSPGGETMYYIDTPTGRVDRYEFDMATGRLGDRRRYVSIAPEHGFPDGLCVDADGCVWVALWGGGAVRRYTPDGSLDREVRVPTPQTTSCTFAGPDLDLLVITTAADGLPGDPHAGLTYACTPGDARGRPVDRFAG